MSRRRKFSGHPADIAARAEKERRARDRSVRSNDPNLTNYVATINAAQHRFGDGFRKLVWSTMVYACVGRNPSPETHGCGWEHRVFLGVGIEGPWDRGKDPLVPCPFYCGRCPKCGSRLAHERFGEDEIFDPILRPPGVSHFVLPSIAVAEKSAAGGYGGADYEQSPVLPIWQGYYEVGADYAQNKAPDRLVPYYRCDGGLICFDCWRPYREHVEEDPDVPELTVLCNRWRVKL